MKLEKGQSLMFGNVNGTRRIWVFDGPKLVGEFDFKDVPQDINLQDGTAKAFVEKEAAKYGLFAKPQTDTPYVFDLV